MTATIDDGMLGRAPDAGNPKGAPPSAAAPPPAARRLARLGSVNELRSRVAVPVWISSLTPVGWSTAALGAFAWVAGVLLGWDELLVLAALCVLLLLLSLPFLFGRLATEALVEVTPTRVQPAGRVVGRVRVRNGWDHRVRGVRVELPVGRGLAQFAIPGLEPGAEHEELFSIPTRRRGVIDVGPVASTRGDALGLFLRSVRWGAAIRVHVHPRTVPIPSVGTGLLRDLEGHATSHLSDADVAFHTLREYTPGDDRRHVHWRSSARAGKLLVRQFVDTRRTHVALLLDTQRGSYSDGAPDRSGPAGEDRITSPAFELAASVAGSLVRRVHADGQGLTLITDSVVVSSQTPLAALDALAGVRVLTGKPGEADPWGRASVRIARFAPEASILVVVTGPGASAGQLRTAAAPVGRDARVVAIRALGAERTTWRESEGLVLIDLASLDDLAPVLMAGSR